jgi:CMP-N-acetylneuraminic acid synthetase
MKTIVALICARGGSKGIKNKNLLKINNKSLLRISIEQAKKITKIKKIFVSTDSKKIAKEAIKYGAIVPFMRPKKLASDSSSEILVWKHAINFLHNNLKIKPKCIISLPVTSPLRKISDIKLSLKKFLKKNLDILFTATKSQKNPYFNIIKKRKNRVVTSINSKKKIHRRQDAPECFDLCTVCYIFKPEYILRSKNLFSGKADFFEVSKKSSLDIDTKFDYDIAKFLYKRK